VDALAVTNQNKLHPLFWRSCQKPWIPSKRNRDPPAVVEGNGHCVFGERDGQGKHVMIRDTSAHSRFSCMFLGFLASVWCLILSAVADVLRASAGSSYHPTAFDATPCGVTVKPVFWLLVL
jgi:hypothetical protein